MTTTAVDAQHFRDCLALWASGVTVCTARDGHGPVGITAASFSSLSLDPPLVLVCIDHRARSHDGLVGAEGFVVHVLAEDQADLSERFARPGPEKFTEEGPLEPGPFGAPLLPLGTARLVCAHHAALEGGDHTILVGRVLEVATTDRRPLVYWARRYRGVTGD
ncbi:MAG TPA: flavin reductase family protein [Miltoncostaeaceae bacterium]|nr:flavin reductase family protein [Miltoncostaeaceae bacterium]